jgi:hypothetical protein
MSVAILLSGNNMAENAQLFHSMTDPFFKWAFNQEKVCYPPKLVSTQQRSYWLDAQPLTSDQ